MTDSLEIDDSIFLSKTIIQTKCIFFAQNMFYRTNAAAPLCIEVVNSFQNIGHLLECSDRHFFKSNDHIATELKQYRVKILQVFSPAWFTIRLLQSRGLNLDNEWTDCNSAHLFEKFNTEFKEFYAQSFAPLDNACEINIDALYVFKDGSDFFRCKILSQK